jgi:hypothetical protein
MIDVASCSEMLRQGLDKYMERKNHLQQQRNQLNHEMNEFILARLDGGTETYSVLSPHDYINRLLPQAPNYCLKFYVCHSRGQQLTPNYTRDHQQWLVEADYIGRNWCWRPYFLTKVAEAKRAGKGILSEPYQDLETRRQIYTFVFPLNANMFLFVDCMYN